MRKPMVTLMATKAKHYGRADLVLGKTFEAPSYDARLLKLLGWAKDPPPKPVATKAVVATKPAVTAPVKSGTYQTADLKPEA